MGRADAGNGWAWSDFLTGPVHRVNPLGRPRPWTTGLTARGLTEPDRYLQSIEDFRRTLSDNSQDLPLSQEQNERIWLDAVGGPSKGKEKGYTVCGNEGSIRFITFFGGIPPCPGDAVRPPPPQSLPISHGVYGQYRDVTEEPSSDEDDEDYYVENTL
ncbi:hypothetical protein BC332_04740 [Capsicum chinense]|nr:hypothetical protein BC332_04740 [Capsicum chinense]